MQLQNLKAVDLEICVSKAHAEISYSKVSDRRKMEARLCQFII